ncbi:sugar ABC transporter permease [Streptomyces griseofuscus]|uniref:ABC transporter permease n=1 Tax=Streptomyces griseofuscus TaxID=146922 RepID=A0A3R8RHQ5_9ACTN|nr:MULTISPECIES: ABC transporter permease subunit [Streptomyces]BBC96415.1 ABC transporter permease [Streptomyces rochei]MBA9045477.1 arabinogalactan oligomer/maltooligosaccharide transport system permease protein [Streptomyces murinus]MBJ7000789.1 ABC transporter permease subunit [Streptomyces sp. CRPSP2-6A1]MYQ94178.1 ABC transporter permease subunit [Streptomyces sp. SID4946]MYR84281.1 ABC transporter permease subunit [Streptomyces sp. SID685]
MSTTTLEKQADAPAPAVTPAGRDRRPGERGPLGTVLLHAGLMVASLIALAPVAWLVYLSLGPDKNDYLHPGGIAGKMSFANYSFVLQHTEFFSWFKSTMIVALGTTVVGVMLAATTGYAVSRMRFPGHKQLMWVLLLTQAFPIAVLIVPMYQIFSDLGLIDSYWALILVNCTTAVPYSAWLLKGYFDTIPIEIDEAGRVDGLTPFGTFFRLILPLARPGLAVAAFYNFITAVAEVAFATTFMLDDSKYTFSVGLQTFVSEHDAEWNYMAATAVLIAIPVSLFFYLVQKNLVTGLTSGGTKG